MDALVNGVKWFIGLFQKGGEVFLGLAGGILPSLIVLLTVIYTITRLIGEERVERWIQRLTRWAVIRYTVAPFLANIVFTVPLEFAVGRFMKEENKPAFYDAQVSLNHPILGIFPHVHPSEIFVYMGIGQGVIDAGYDIAPLAVRFFLAGLVVILIRGLVTDRIYQILARRRAAAVTAA